MKVGRWLQTGLRALGGHLNILLYLPLVAIFAYRSRLIQQAKHIPSLLTDQSCAFKALSMRVTRNDPFALCQRTNTCLLLRPPCLSPDKKSFHLLLTCFEKSFLLYKLINRLPRFMSSTDSSTESLFRTTRPFRSFKFYYTNSKSAEWIPYRKCRLPTF